MIGIFDSGIGGLNVLKEAMRQLPTENYIYFADTKNVPYGTKPKEDVKRFVFEAADFLLGKDVKAIVIACNTATSVAVNDLRNSVKIPVIGMEPAIKPAVEKNGDGQKRVLVIATPLTLKEEKFKNLVSKVDSFNIVDSLPMPELVEFAEKMEFSNAVLVPFLKQKLSGFDLNQYGTVVLGCTHFNYFTNSMRKVLPADVDIIDGIEGTVKHLKKVLEERNLISNYRNNGETVFYCSGSKIVNQRELEKYKNLLALR